MKILVTGGAGFIGSVLVPKLLQRFPQIHDHYHVTVLDSFSHGENSLSACCGSPNFEAVRGDARDVRILEPLVKKADVIIPLAAIVGAPACAKDESAATSTNTRRAGVFVPGTTPNGSGSKPLAHVGRRERRLRRQGRRRSRHLEEMPALCRTHLTRVVILWER